MLLSLDPSTNCGFALCEPFTDRPRMRVGSWHLCSGTNFERASELADRVGVLVLSEGVERVAIEVPMSAPPRPVKRVKETALGFEVQEVSQGSLQTQALLWALHGGIAGALAAAGVPGHPVGMKEWRKAVFGNGNIKGAESKARCRELASKLGVSCTNNDQAEAFGIAIWLNGHLRRLRAEEELQRRAA